MHTLPILKPGDSVEVIAPASRCSDKQLLQLKGLLADWQLNCIVADDIFGDDLLCANSDQRRFTLLKQAFENPHTKAIICARGGYGSMRLMPELMKLTPPKTPKLFIGMSDITALHLYLQQHWQWQTLHGSLSTDKFSQASIAALKAFVFGEINQVEWVGQPLNELAKKKQVIEATITGGNLSLVQASIGTIWQMQGAGKIILLEDVSERGYRVDRILEHLRQTTLFHNVAAILFGDFTEGNEPDGSSLIRPVLERFAQGCDIPVIKVEGIGHGFTNFPMPLGTVTRLQMGDQIKVTVFR